MNPNPFAGLAKSRKFWLAVLDASVSTAVLIATRYLSPADLQLVKEIIFGLQPVILAVIASIAYEDAASTKAQAAVDVAVAQGPVAQPYASTVSTTTALAEAQKARMLSATEAYRPAPTVVPAVPYVPQSDTAPTFRSGSRETRNQ